MIRGLFLFIFIQLACFAAFSSEQILIESQQKNLSQSKEWKNLLHWRWNLFGGTEGEADSDSFYFHPNGQEDLKLELEATIRAFSANKKYQDLNEHPACKFPARYLFLKKNLSSASSLKSPVCSKYNDFFNKVSAKGISLVFSSYFISRPASAFGHTLMRFSKNRDVEEGRKYELLDYAANYSANVTTSNALLYGLLGLAGGFKGEFAAMPYFYKIREYNDFESRDLWDYHLDLKPKEIERVIAHLWEMGSTNFRYFYLTENCSYHMLGLLDVANPKWGLTDRNPYFVVPADTIAIVSETPGLVRKVTYRPSKMTTLKYRLSLLNNEERKAFDKMADSLEPIEFNASKESQAKVLDTALDYVDFKFAEEILMKESEEKKIKNKFLIARAQLGVKSDTLKVPAPKEEMPHLGHKTRRLAFGMGTSSRSEIFSKAEFRFAMHDLLDLTTGQNPNATMEMGNFQIRYFHEDKFRNKSSSVRLENAYIAQVEALTPLEPYFSDMSWRASFGGRTINDGGCLDCFSPTSQIGAGISLKFGDIISYFMAVTDLDFNKELGRRGYRAGIGPEAKIILRLNKTLSWDLTGSWKRNFFVEQNKESYTYGSEIRFHTYQNLNFGLKYQRHHKYWDSIAKVFYYY